MKNFKMKFWSVVKVESGIPVLNEVYSTKQEAKKREKYYRELMNPENDETAIFEIFIPIKSRQIYHIDY